jgi:hypothetical protein
MVSVIFPRVVGIAQRRDQPPQVEQLPPTHPEQEEPEEPEELEDEGISNPLSEPFLWRQQDMSFCEFFEPQAGQSGVASPKTTSSNSLPQSGHLYSKIGMMFLLK